MAKPRRAADLQQLGDHSERQRLIRDPSHPCGAPQQAPRRRPASRLAPTTAADLPRQGRKRIHEAPFDLTRLDSTPANPNRRELCP